MAMGVVLLSKLRKYKGYKMKIVLTGSGDSLDSMIDKRFGRAALFISYDLESGEYTVHDNKQNLNAAQGAGIQAAEKVCSIGAEAVITGHCGPKAFRALSAAGIKVYCGAEGSISSVIEDFRSGNLVVSESADVEGHW